MSDWLRTRPTATAALIATFGDAATIAHALAFETALARAEAEEGLIGAAAAEAIASVCAELAIEPEALARQLRSDAGGTATVVVTRVAGAPTVLVCDVSG